MKYTNIILTLIAVILIILTLTLHKGLNVRSEASTGTQDVNIARIGGTPIYSKVLKVEVK